jgi:anaphase-promoting complex subunit 1
MAAQLDLPDTHFSLDNIRPDFLFLNVVARSLILWDEVEGSSNWIENQVPAFIQDFYTRFRRKLEKETESEDDRIEVDTKAMKEAHAFIIAGACFSLGLRFAGTGDEQARDAVFEKVVDFQKFRDESVSISLCPQRPVVEMCLGSAAISLSLIMAGTGDLKTLRLLKMLRWRCDDATKYGTHMSFGAAIGMLFLGGGACTLGRGPEDIAALLMAFFPRFPMSTQDNQYHLQALRHMYSLAVKQRRIEAIDIDSREKIFVPIKVRLVHFVQIYCYYS